MYSQITVAGAGGFVGQALTRALAVRYPEMHVIGLSRGPREPAHGVTEWRGCDLFSLLDAERGLAGSQAAFYLVHSMLPSAGLTQGAFYDLDLIAADNFARAARGAGLRQIIYLGGLVPEGAPVSAHLASRLEVERALGAYGTPVTALRAGMVVGAEGSSFQILERLVRRLPLMLTPAWTRTPTQPIDVADIVTLLIFCLGRPETFGREFDVGGPEVLSYREMIRALARLLGRNPLLLGVPLFSPGLSRAWVSWITGAPKNLVKPLVQGLHHPMVARERRLQEMARLPGRSFEQSARTALEKASLRAPRAFGRASEHTARDVRSVQRLPRPPGRDADWAAQEYFRWLPKALPFLLRVETDRERVTTVRLFGIPLLVLAYSFARSTPDRALYYVQGGWLARTGGRARFEIRGVSGEPWFLAALHEFRPRLPWRIYGVTQAKLHLWVMRAYGWHLRRATRFSRSERQSRRLRFPRLTSTRRNQREW